VNASAEGTETVLATTCQRYDAFVDFEQARRAASRPVALPLYARDTPVRDSDLDLTRLPFEVWLDASERIRRVILHGGRKSLTQLELSGFGEPDPVDLPQPDEIVLNE